MSQPPIAPTTSNQSAIFTKERWISPSQLSTLGLCPRKWYYQKITKIPEPQGAGAAAGDYAHKQIEAYLKGLPYDPLPHVQALIPFLPKPGTPGWHIEVVLKIPGFLPGMLLTGRIDLVNESESYCDSLGVWRDSKNVLEIIDHKFMIPRYWLTSQQLREDMQLNVYALAMLGDRDMIRISHQYAERAPEGAPAGWRGDRAKVTALRTRQELLDWRERVLTPAVRELHETAACASVADTRVKAPKACDSYGGCHYGPSKKPNDGKLGICTMRLSDDEIGVDLFKSLQMKVSSTSTVPSPGTGDASTAETMIISLEETKPMGLFESLKQKQSAGGTPAVTSAGGTPAVTSAVTPAATTATPPATTAPVATTATPPPVTATPTVSAPVEAPKQEPAPVEAPATQPVVTSPVEAAELGVETPATAAMRAEMAKSKAEAEAEEAKEAKKGRKRGSEPKENAPVATSVDATAAYETLNLYVNCVPYHPSRNLDQYVQGLCNKLCDEYKLPDVRCASGNDHPLAFGKWKGALATRAANTPPSNGDWWIITKNSEVNEVVADALAKLPNARVVRGI